MVSGGYLEQTPQKRIRCSIKRDATAGLQQSEKGGGNQSTEITKPGGNKDRTGPISPPSQRCFGLYSFPNRSIPFHRPERFGRGGMVPPSGRPAHGSGPLRTNQIEVNALGGCVCPRMSVCDCIRNRAPAEQNVRPRPPGGGASRAKEKSTSFPVCAVVPRVGDRQRGNLGSLQMASLIMQGMGNSREMVEARDIRGFLHRGPEHLSKSVVAGPGVGGLVWGNRTLRSHRGKNMGRAHWGSLSLKGDTRERSRECGKQN